MICEHKVFKKVIAAVTLCVFAIVCISCVYDVDIETEIKNDVLVSEDVGTDDVTVTEKVKKETAVERMYLPAPADASYDSCGENATWRIEGETLYIDGKGAMWDYSLDNQAPWAASGDSIKKIVVADEINIIGSYAFAYLKNAESVELGKGVSIIGDSAFYGLDALWSIELPSNVVKIEDYAFKFCINLNDVKFNDGLLHIGEGAFALCYDLYEIVIPHSVTTIKRDAFNGCSRLRAVRLPSGIEKIGVWCFADCGLELVAIPASLTFISTGMFDGCDNLKDVYFGGTSDEWSGVEIEENNSPLENVNFHFNS